jgi:hypothetical protein
MTENGPVKKPRRGLRLRHTDFFYDGRGSVDHDQDVGDGVEQESADPSP